MNAPLHVSVLDSLGRLNARIRWKRWLGKLLRFVCLLALTFAGLFAADWLLGLDTLSLRIASAAMLAAIWRTCFLLCRRGLAGSSLSSAIAR